MPLKKPNFKFGTVIQPMPPRAPQKSNRKRRRDSLDGTGVDPLQLRKNAILTIRKSHYILMHYGNRITTAKRNRIVDGVQALQDIVPGWVTDFMQIHGNGFGKLSKRTPPRTRKFTEKQVAKLYKIYKSQFGSQNVPIYETLATTINRTQRLNRAAQVIQKAQERRLSRRAEEGAAKITNVFTPQKKIENLSYEEQVARGNIVPGLSGTAPGGKRIPLILQNQVAEYARGNFLSHDPERPFDLIGKRVVLRMANGDWHGTVTHYDAVDKTHRIMFDDFEAKWRDLRELGGKDGQGIWDEGQWTPSRRTHKPRTVPKTEFNQSLDKEARLQDLQVIFSWKNVYTEYQEFANQPVVRNAGRWYDRVLNGFSMKLACGNLQNDNVWLSKIVKGPWESPRAQRWRRHRRADGTLTVPVRVMQTNRPPNQPPPHPLTVPRKSAEWWRKAVLEDKIIAAVEHICNFHGRLPGDKLTAAGVQGNAWPGSENISVQFLNLIDARELLGDDFSKEAEDVFDRWVEIRGAQTQKFLRAQILQDNISLRNSLESQRRLNKWLNLSKELKKPGVRDMNVGDDVL